MSIKTKQYAHCDTCGVEVLLRGSIYMLPREWSRVSDSYGNETHACGSDVCRREIVLFAEENEFLLETNP